MKFKTSGLVLALTLSAASVSLAQQPTQTQPEKQHAERTDRARRPGSYASLLSGIELTAAQKDQLKATRKKHENKSDKKGGQEFRKQLKTAREKADTATERRIRGDMRTEMIQRHDAMVADIRQVLTPTQLQTFEKNVTEDKQRLEKHGDRGERARVRPVGNARASS